MGDIIISNKEAIVTNVKRFALNDGPGIRTTVFFKGCPLRCRWCSNPEAQDSFLNLLYDEEACIECKKCTKVCPYNAVDPPEKIEREICYNDCGYLNIRLDSVPCVEACNMNALRTVGRKMDLESLISIVMKDYTSYKQTGGGVTASGGEPLQQTQFLYEFFRKISKRNIHTVLDTCGHAEWNDLDKVTDWVKLVYYDIKLIDKKLHKEYTGVDNELILENIQKLSNKAVNDEFDIVVRIPLIPNYTSSKTNVENIAKFLASDTEVNKVELLPYHSFGEEMYYKLGRNYPLKEIKPSSNEEIETLKRIIEKKGLDIYKT